MNKNETTVEHIPLSQIVPDENQPRKMFEPSRLAQLKSSVEKFGIMNPITVEKVGNKYLIVDGERRYRTATVLGLKTVPAVVIAPQSEVDRLVQQFHIQEQHEGWSPTEKAMVLFKLSKEMGIPMKTAIELLGIDTRTASNYIAFSSLLEKSSFQKNNVGIKWADRISGLKKFVVKILEKGEEELDRSMERELEKAVIRRIVDGSIKTTHDITKIKDSFKKKPESMKEFVNTDVSPETLFTKSKAQGAYYIRNIEYGASHLNDYLKNFLEIKDMKVEVGLINKVKLTKKLINDFLNLVD